MARAGVGGIALACFPALAKSLVASYKRGLSPLCIPVGFLPVDATVCDVGKS